MARQIQKKESGSKEERLARIQKMVSEGSAGKINAERFRKWAIEGEWTHAEAIDLIKRAARRNWGEPIEELDRSGVRLEADEAMEELSMAVVLGSNRAIAALVRAGAEYWKDSVEAGISPMKLAVVTGKLDELRVMLDAGPQGESHARQLDGELEAIKAMCNVLGEDPKKGAGMIRSWVERVRLESAKVGSPERTAGFKRKAL